MLRVSIARFHLSNPNRAKNIPAGNRKSDGLRLCPFGGELRAQVVSTAAQTGHYRSDRDSQSLVDLFVRELLDIGQDHDLGVLLRHLFEGGKQLLIGQLVRDFRLGDKRVFERLWIFAEQPTAPLPPMVRHDVEQDLVQPGSTVGTGFEAIKGFPRLE
jgi:hypothetical protein